MGIRMASTQPQDQGGFITDINVTPMVDIMLVLLIIFMVTATYITRNAIEVQLPQAATGEEVATNTLAVSITKDGDLLLNGEATSLDDLKKTVPEMLKQSPDLQAVVDGDRFVPYGRVMEVIDTLRALGVKNFAASVEKKAESEVQ